MLLDYAPRLVLSRRAFLQLAAARAGIAMTPAFLSGCAVDPVTGRSTLVGLDEKQEIAVDRQYAPQQFSADYGAVQDKALNGYVAEVGTGLWTRSHRPQMPYSARVVNANYINAYTFPAGTMAVTRGIMLEMQNEDELAALLGHETGHVNARHAAEQAGRGMIAQLGSVAAQIGLAAAGLGDLGGLASQITQVGASALLASYSRDDEREADALGMEYMTRAGYNADGMVGLMDILRREAREEPSMIETMFSSHPMSDERYATAREAAASKYAASRSAQIKRERYMDSTASVRAIAPAIQAQRRGETLLARRKAPEAERELAQALKRAPDDYTGLLLMTQAKLVQKQYAQAEPFVDRAVAVYPTEGQGLKLAGMVKLAQKKPDVAFQRFDAYDKVLPGNPATAFFKGVSMEGMQRPKEAAQYYVQYLRAGGEGAPAKHAQTRLRQWGVIR